MRDIVIEAAARIFFVDAWADDLESKNLLHYPGQDLLEVAPKTSPKAEEFAGAWLERMELLNSKTTDQMLAEAAEKDGAEVTSEFAEDFGSLTALQALGHGVKWSDNHGDYKYQVPPAEVWGTDIIDG